MKTISFALLLMASTAFVLLGCSDKSASLVSPSDQTLSRTAELTATGLGKTGPELHSVSGNSHNFLHLNSGAASKKWDCFSNVTLSARLGQDNTTSGSICSRYIGAPPPGFFPPFSGRIIQLMVEDNPGVGKMAKVMFEITKGAELFPPEWGFGPTPVGCFVWIDGGEGTKAPPDCGSTCWAIDNPEVMHFYGFYEMSPSDYLQSTVPWLPPGLTIYQLIDNGNIQVR